MNALQVIGLLIAAGIVGLILDIRHANKQRAEKTFEDRKNKFVARLNRVRAA